MYELPIAMDDRGRKAALARAPRYGIEYEGLHVSLQAISGLPEERLRARRIRNPRRGDWGAMETALALHRGAKSPTRLSPDAACRYGSDAEQLSDARIDGPGRDLQHGGVFQIPSVEQ